MRGRRPALRTIEGGKGRQKRPAEQLMPMPAHVPPEANAEWQRVVRDLRERGLLEPAMLSTIASYCIATWQIAEYVAAIRQDGAFVRTKTGEPKPHPALGLLNKAQELVARLAAELALTPAARSRKGLRGEEREPEEGLPAGLDL